MAKTYNLYISHSWKRSEQLDRLRSLLENRGYFSAAFLEASPDNSINSRDIAYVKRRLALKVGAADVLLVMSGIYATTSDFIRHEMEVAYELGIPIIGIVPRGQINISTLVQYYAAEIVNWNTESVVAAIRRQA